MKWYDHDFQTWQYDKKKDECVPKTHPIHMGAEYRFVPVFPRAAPAPVQPGNTDAPLSHARPVAGGFSGVLEFDLIAETPVLFGRHEKIDDKDITTHARLYEGGPFAAPGRAIRGLLRNVYGIITCSRFSPINGDHRFYSRNMDYLTEFANKTRKDSKPQMAWLYLDVKEDGGAVKISGRIRRMATYDPKNGEVSIAIKKVAIKAGLDEKKWKIWSGFDINKKHQFIGRKKGNFDFYDKYLVVSGPMRTKKREALFPLLKDEPEKREEINAEALAGFLFANSKYAKNGAEYPMGGRRTPEGNFRLFLAEWLFGLGQENGEKLARSLGLTWKEVKDTAKRHDKPPGIPVYCWGDPKDPTFEMGTSQVVPKGPAGPVKNFLEQKGLEASQLDWADALFGRVEDDGPEDLSLTLKGRLFCEFAPAEGEELCPEDEAVIVTQGQPKASFDPFYLKRKEPNGHPAIWADDSNATLSGYKRYPACRNVRLPRPFKIKGANISKVDSLVRPLERGARYACRVAFHNLHPLELGALLWAVSFGDPAVFTGEETRFRHVAGRLRNRGLGRLRPANARLAALEQNPMPPALGWRNVCCEDATLLALLLMQAFEVHMGRFMKKDEELEAKKARKAFYECDTITALLNSSDAHWDDQAQGHNRCRMFYIPDGDERFKYFNNLRRLHYKKFHEDRKCEDKEHRLLPEPGKTTILDEFMKPVGGPNAGPFAWPREMREKCASARADADEKADTVLQQALALFIDPLRAIAEWREKRTAMKEDG